MTSWQFQRFPTRKSERKRLEVSRTGCGCLLVGPEGFGFVARAGPTCNLLLRTYHVLKNPSESSEEAAIVTNVTHYASSGRRWHARACCPSAAVLLHNKTRRLLKKCGYVPIGQELSLFHLGWGFVQQGWTREGFPNATERKKRENR